MSFWDNVKKFAQPYSDDEYDDVDEEEYEDTYEEPAEEPQPAPRRARRSAPAAAVEPAPEPETATEESFFDAAPVVSAASRPAASTSTGYASNVLNMNTASSNKQDVVLFRPNNFNDCTKAANDLCARKAVVVNLENVDKAMARRVIDMLTGCVYALHGEVQKIAQSAYLFCPPNMSIQGNLETIQPDVEQYV